MKRKYVILIILLIGVLSILYVGMKVYNKKLPVENKSQTKQIHKLVNNFYSAIRTQNSSAFKNIMSSDGVMIYRTFLLGNGTLGKEVFENIKRSKISNKLVFNLVKGEYPISLKSTYQNNNINFSKVKILKTKWRFDLNLLYRPQILDTCAKITGKYEGNNDKFTAFIYVLKDGNFCVVQYAGSGLDYSRWAIFKKYGKKYALRVIALIN